MDIDKDWLERTGILDESEHNDTINQELIQHEIDLSNVSQYISPYNDHTENIQEIQIEPPEPRISQIYDPDTQTYRVVYETDVQEIHDNNDFERISYDIMNELQEFIFKYNRNYDFERICEIFRSFLTRYVNDGTIHSYSVNEYFHPSQYNSDISVTLRKYNMNYSFLINTHLI